MKRPQLTRNPHGHENDHHQQDKTEKQGTINLGRFQKFGDEPEQ
jgi:hypothetical protein